MIKTWPICTASEKQNLFDNFDATASTWVVADVQSRSFLQSQLLARRPFLEETSVVIAGELWQELLFLADPQYRLISEDMARSMIWEWLRPLNLAWAKTPASARRILQQLDHLSPLLAHKGNEALLQEWFETNRESVIRWRHWYEVGRRLWRDFEERKWALASWIPAILVQPTFPRPRLGRRLIFDLGVRMSPVEMQFVRELAKQHDVEVIIPKPDWADAFVTTCEPYRLIEETADRKKDPSASAGLMSFPSSPRYRRFSTHLAEVKDATAQVREWLDSGVAPANIAVVSADMEVYGSALHAFFEQEGIPVQKSAPEPLHSHPDIAHWLSEIRIKLNRFSRKDLEVHLFQNSDETTIPYDEFRRLFGRFYDVEDLRRWPELEKKLAVLPGLRCTQREFLDWSLRLCPKGADADKIAALISEFSKDGIIDLPLTADVWIGMLEDLAARMPIATSQADPDGVFILNLGSAEWMPATHVCFLNASENVLRRWNDSPFSAAEAGKLMRDLGFAIASHEAQPSEFELCWLLSRPLKAVEFCFAGADFSGEALTPSRFWLLGAHATGTWRHAASPRVCRWDEIQQSKFEIVADLRKWSGERRMQTETALDIELGRTPPAKLPLLGGFRMSASSLEKFQKCAFLFAAEKVFQLREEPLVDLDLDRMSKGRLMHRLFSYLSMEPFRADWSDAELLMIIDQSRAAEKIHLAEERLWQPLRSAHLRLAKQFLRMEREMRARFPQSKTLAAEVAFECGWDSTNARWSKDGAIRFSGRIDRVDGDSQKNYMLIDYKSSVGNLRNWESWIRNDQLQLAVYSELLEEGLASLPAGSVEAAVYYVAKAESRSRGFFARENSGHLFELESRSRGKISAEQKKDLYQSVHLMMTETTKKISTGEFFPVPKKTSTCEECAWNRLCRAPHLG